MPKIILLSEDEKRASEYIRGNTLRIYLYSEEAEFVIKGLIILLDVKIVEFLAKNSTEEGFLELSLNTYLGKFSFEMLILSLAKDWSNDALIYILKEKSGML